MSDYPPPNRTEPISSPELRQRLADPERFNIVVTPLRPGACLFMTRLEFEHYEPDTPRNDLFDFFESVWEESSWYITSIPACDRHLAEKLAEEMGMRLSNGVPHVITPEGLKSFVIDSPNTYTLEGKAEMTRDEEIVRADSIIQAHWLKFQAKGRTLH